MGGSENKQSILLPGTRKTNLVQYGVMEHAWLIAMAMYVHVYTLNYAHNVQGHSQDFRKGGAKNARIARKNFEPEATPNN